jgi:hypothetical protein
MTDPLLFAFESGTWPGASFGHRDHVHVAWLYLREEEATIALARFADALRRHAARAGVPERYHETITWAFLLMIHERMAKDPTDSWEAFAEKNPALFDRALLGRYYRQETLDSDLARRTFLFPDRIEAT